MRKQYKSEILATVHETALGLHEAGVLNKATMKTFDEMCLTPEQIRQIRLREKVGQFEKYSE